MKFNLEGKVALVTGGAQGIGLGTGQALARRGAKVVLADLDAEGTRAAAASIGDEDAAIGLAADVTDRAAVDAAVATAVERFGRLDVAVANAGVASPVQTIAATSDADYHRVINVNQHGVWNTVQAVLPQIRANHGHIHVVSSIYAFFNGMGQVPYAMSKAAVEQLGRALRAELSVDGATAGVAYFGFIDTAMVRTALADRVADEMVKQAPPGLGKKISPEAAGEVLADGIAKRATIVLAPKAWHVPRMLRAVLPRIENGAIGRNPKLRKTMKTIDVPAAERLPEVWKRP